MKLADVSIRRPVFATMMVSALVVFGAFLYRKLNVDLYPEVDFPIVTVTVIYPGADPETMEQQVADPIEEAVNSLSGIRSLKSASIEGVTRVYVEFQLGVNLDTATQDVRDRVSTTIDNLPEGIETPMVEKLDLGAMPIIQLAVSGTVDETSLAHYAEHVLKPTLERVGGVGQVELVGSREREIHVWIDPGALRQHGLTVQEVVGALGRQNLDVPGGRVIRGGREFTVRTDAQTREASTLRELVVATVNGVPVRLASVATIEDGFEERRSIARVDANPAIAVVIRKQSDANTVVAADAVKRELDRLRAEAPRGIDTRIMLDNSIAVRASIETVQFDLVIGALLAVTIIFLFLRDPRATLISALALPTSVIGTFAFVYAMGFTLNMMTTLALSLSVGILIDDAIVVIENIVRRRDELHENAMDAASRGTAEIGLAVLATTLSLVAVFVPVAFMEGIVGQFFFEFGLTVAVAVLLSLFVSFTLTPMLSSKFLVAHSKPKGLSALIGRGLDAMDRGYRRVVRWALGHRLATLGIATGVLFGTFYLAQFIDAEFIGVQDRGQFAVNVELPVGSTLDDTDRAIRGVTSRLRSIPGVRWTFATVGGGVEEKVNAATIVVDLVPTDQRSFHQTEAMAHARRLLGSSEAMRVSIGEVDAGPAGGATVQLLLRGDDLGQLEATSERIAARLRAEHGLVDVDTSFRSGKPEIDVVLRRTEAGALGVTADSVAMTVRTLIAGTVAAKLQGATDRYDIRVQLPEHERSNEATLDQAQVRTSTGTLVELATIVDLHTSEGPSQIDREARQRQIVVGANLEGRALGDAVERVMAIAGEEVGPGVTHAIGGEGQMLEESMVSMGIAFLLAIVCVYMILAAQFESFVHPFTIMMSLPFSFVGVLLGLLVTGENLSIFAMIGLIMLMGLVTKNAILLVDFAIQRMTAGEAMNDAMENAGATRLRPILMTTAAMVFGMLPVAIGHGDGGEVRAPMGVTVIGGLITSTVLTLIVVPVVYTLFEQARRRVMGVSRRRKKTGDDHAAQSGDAEGSIDRAPAAPR